MAESDSNAAAVDQSWIFRGDVKYRRGDAAGARAYDVGRDILERALAAHDHVRDMLRGRESGFRSFTLSQAVARNIFAAGDKNAVIKARLSDLRQLQAQGTIKMYPPDDIYDLLLNSGDVKLKKVASAVRQIMQTNDEVVIEGIVPASMILPVS